MCPVRGSTVIKRDTRMPQLIRQRHSVQFEHVTIGRGLYLTKISFATGTRKLKVITRPPDYLKQAGLIELDERALISRGKTAVSEVV